MSTFDAARGAAERDAALAAVATADSALWREAAYKRLLIVAENRIEFTTDAVWFLLERDGIAPPREPRAMGPVIMRAVRFGICTPTDRVKRSLRVECHRRPVAVYRSLKAGPGALPLSEDGSLFAPRTKKEPAT